ncbi:MAG: hypothetical protein ABIC57_02365 [bacterium]
MTLTEAAKFSKKATKLFLLSVGLILTGWIVYNIINPSLGIPDDYLEPNNMCGIIDELTLNSLTISTPNTNFQVEMASGAIPKIAEVVNVYKYANPGHNLWGLEEAQMKAEALGFTVSAYSRKGSTIYEWTDKDTNQTLTVDTANQNFTLTTDFANNNIDTLKQYLPNETDAKRIALNFLSQKNLLTSDYSDGYQVVIPIEVTANGEFREAASIADSDLVRVDLFRYKDLITVSPDLVDTNQIGSSLQEQLEQEKTTYVTTNGTEEEVKQYATAVIADSPILGNIQIYLGGNEYSNTSKPNVFAVNYVNWIIGDSPCGTYRLITPQAAVKRVQDREGYLVHLLEDEGDRLATYEPKAVKNLTIFKVELVYLDLEEEQNYMQPIYLISGEAEFDGGVYGEFYYYVPAVDYDVIPADAGTPQTTQDSTSN